MKAGELKKVLEIVKPGLANRDVLEQATSFIFHQGRVYSFNDQVAVIAPFELGADGAVNSNIYAFASKLKPDAEITLETINNELRFVSGRSKAGVVIEADIKLPLEEELKPPEEWYPLPGNFLSSVKSCLFSAAKSGNAPILTCVHIFGDFIETCDEYRITRYVLDEAVVNKDSNGNPKDANGIKVVARNLIALPAGRPTEYGFNESWMQFRNPDTGLIYCVRMVDGQYPDLEELLECIGAEIEFPKELNEALDWSAVPTDDAKKFEQKVHITIGKGLMSFRGEGLESWATQDIRFRYTGEPIKFSAHPEFLKEMSKLAQKVTIGANSLRIDGGNFVHVVSFENEEEGE
jgi:hypothetical protein